MDESALMTYREAAEMLHFSQSNIRMMVHVGKLTPIKLAGHREKYLNRADVLAYGPNARETAASAPLTHQDTMIAAIQETYQYMTAHLTTTMAQLSADYRAAILAATGMKG